MKKDLKNISKVFINEKRLLYGVKKEFSKKFLLCSILFSVFFGIANKSFYKLIDNKFNDFIIVYLYNGKIIDTEIVDYANKSILIDTVNVTSLDNTSKKLYSNNIDLIKVPVNILKEKELQSINFENYNFQIKNYEIINIKKLAKK